MGILDVKIVQDYIRMCTDGWKQGWHERNGGTDLPHAAGGGRAVPSLLPNGGRMGEHGCSWKNLAGKNFDSTEWNIFRNVALIPAHNIGIVQIDSAGGSLAYRMGPGRWCKADQRIPEPDLDENRQRACGRAREGIIRVIYHAHTPESIAMTYVLPLTARDSPVPCAERHRMPGGFPGGVGDLNPDALVANIALATLGKLMKQYDAAVWAHHGLFCSGPDFDTTFGLMHTIEKAAQIWVLAQSAGQGKSMSAHLGRQSARHRRRIRCYA